MSDEPTFAEALRKVRKARGMTQAALAADAGVTRTHLVRIERAHVDPGPATHDQLLAALGFVYELELLAAAVPAKTKARRTT